MKILLVDDSKTISLLFSARLRGYGHEVILAENGAIAVEKFMASAPDLVLMDVEMPVLDGFSATSRIRQFEASQKWAWTPIIFLTSTSTPENFATSIDAGGDDLIAKEVPEIVLQAKLKAMARVAKLRQELFSANLHMEQDIEARQVAEDELSKRCSELTELNGKLASMQAKIVQTEKLASLGQMAAGVAHEINTPLGFVLSNLGTLSKYFENLRKAIVAYAEKMEFSDSAQSHSIRRDFDIDYINEDIPTLLNESHDGILRISRIVNNLKDFSQQEDSPEWKLSDLQQQLDAILRIVSGQFKSEVKIIKEYGAIPLIECIPEQINQVFTNLLANAYQALDCAHGEITLRTGTTGKDTAWIEFDDKGCGIAEEIKPKIFDPFFTTRPVGKGAGLGLSLSYGIMERHRGRIDFDSTKGKGSCFRLTLPIRRTLDSNL